MKTIRRWLRGVEFWTAVMPIIVPLVLMCLVMVGFLVGYSVRLGNEAMIFIIGLLAGSTLTMFGIIISLRWLTKMEQHRHEQVIKHLNEEIETNRGVRKSWFSNMIWKVGDNE